MSLVKELARAISVCTLMVSCGPYLSSYYLFWTIFCFSIYIAVLEILRYREFYQEKWKNIYVKYIIQDLKSNGRYPSAMGDKKKQKEVDRPSRRKFHSLSDGYRKRKLGKVLTSPWLMHCYSNCQRFVEKLTQNLQSHQT